VWRVRIFVDPEHWRRGIGSSLLAEREARAAKAGVRAIESFVDTGRTGARAFAEARGYSVFCHDLFLTRDASRLIAPSVDGVTCRRGGEADFPAWVSLFNATLSRDVVFVEATLESAAAHSRSEGFALWLAERNGVPIGFCHVERRGRLGFVQSVGVLAAEEGRGIGAALLSRGIDAIRESVDRIELCTEKDNVRAQRLYARIGFVLDREAFTYRKKISSL
jgi:ribosomal protein S18 acetylase RimI-like enzyme